MKKYKCKYCEEEKTSKKLPPGWLFLLEHYCYEDNSNFVKTFYCSEFCLRNELTQYDEDY